MAEPNGYCTHCNDACLRCSSDDVFEDPEERAAVVRFLRTGRAQQLVLGFTAPKGMERLADAIERGEHRK